MHSNPASACDFCILKLEGCHDALKLWHEIIADNFKDCHISIGFRSEKDQEAALQQHLTHAPWPLSKHNKIDDKSQPCSWAIDVFRLGDDGKAYFEKSYFEQIWDFINSLQIQAGDSEMYWGGLFTTLKDFDHFELLKVDIVQSIHILSQDSC